MSMLRYVLSIVTSDHQQRSTWQHRKLLSLPVFHSSFE